jgi:hypothetical protein
MPWSYDIDTGRSVVFTTGTGVLTGEDLAGGVRAVYLDPRFRSDMRALCDYSQVPGWQVSNELVASLASKRKFSATARTAFFVTGPLIFGIARMYQAWVDNGQVKIFTDRGEAVAWLNEGVPPEKHIA